MFFYWCQVKGHEATGTNCNTVFIKRKGRTSFSQTLEQVVQRGCGVTIIGDIQRLAEHNSEHFALFDPTFELGLELEFI